MNVLLETGIVIQTSHGGVQGSQDEKVVWRVDGTNVEMRHLEAGGAVALVNSDTRVRWGVGGDGRWKSEVDAVLGVPTMTRAMI